MSTALRWIKREWPRALVGLIVIAILVLAGGAALARPGGGNSFSGGSHSSSSSPSSSGSHTSSGSQDSSDDGDWGLGGGLIGLVIELLWMAIRAGWEHPDVGLPVLCVLLFMLMVVTKGSGRWIVLLGSAVLIGLLRLGKDSPGAAGGVVLALLIAALVRIKVENQRSWSSRSKDASARSARRKAALAALAMPEPSAPATPEPSAPVTPEPWTAPVPGQSSGLREKLEMLRTIDPDFSVVLFEDTLATLFTEVHRARGLGALDLLAPYVNESTRARLASRPVSSVRDILIGAIRFIRVGLDPSGRSVSVGVEIEANYTEVTPAGKEKGLYVVETWSLARSREARSMPPERVRILGCPSCGAPLEKAIGGACKYCNAVVSPGQLDWMVDSILTTRRDDRGPVLTADVEEQGTDFPTVVDAHAEERLAALVGRDPAFSLDALRARVEPIFQQLQIAWSSREWTPVRPFVSDNLFQSLSYWIETYRKAALRNVTEGARITAVELARVTSDRWFDAITLRVRATSLDYVLTDDGTLVSGSRQQERLYTEYWTLIRSAARKGPPREGRGCPSCGAELKINMAGHCEYCSAKVTSGEFDWVLSRIEQDEVYTG